MNKEMTAEFKLDDLVNEVQNDIENTLEFEFGLDQRCIYRVPKKIRQVNDEAYTPRLISIGPLHHDKKKLVDMEQKKINFVKGFFKRITEEKQGQILNHIKSNEKKIRNYYAEISKLGSHKFVKMILYDSIFIIELFLINKTNDKSDILLDVVPIKSTLCSDLQLFENQLPYFILEEIYNLAGDVMPGAKFMDLVVNFFPDFLGFGLSGLTHEVKHFIDWRRITLREEGVEPESVEEGVEPESVEKGVKKVVRDLPSAVKLNESGIKLKGIIGTKDKANNGAEEKASIGTKEKKRLLDIKFEKRKQLIPFFEICELQIPQLKVDDETERLLRNVIALEQCVYPQEALVSNYVDLMNYLINTVEDVDLLVRENIISNLMGDNASVAKMFNKLNQNVDVSNSPYHDTSEQLKSHYNSPWNRAKATLKRVYFSNPWRGTATIAAIILLFLTVIQTVCSILQIERF